MITEDSFNIWKTFINNHQHLKKLRASHLTLHQLVELTESLADLIEVELTVSNFESVQLIRVFLQSHSSLMKAQITTYNFDDAGMQILRDSLQNEWDYKEYGNNFDNNSDGYDFFETCEMRYNFELTRKI